MGYTRTCTHFCRFSWETASLPSEEWRSPKASSLHFKLERTVVSHHFKLERGLPTCRSQKRETGPRRLGQVCARLASPDIQK